MSWGCRSVNLEISEGVDVKTKSSSSNDSPKTGDRDRALGWLGFGTGLAAGVVLMFWRAHRRRFQYSLPQATALRAALESTIDPGEVELALALAEINYAHLRADAPQRENKALQAHLLGNILPGLALYRALQDVLGSQDQALKVVEQAYIQVFPAKLALKVRALQYVPLPFDLFRKALHWQMETSFPQEGWQIEWLEDNARHVAFNLHTCLYLDTLRAYGAEELTAVFCRLDDLMYDPPLKYMNWERTTTLARGGPYCDFRWSKRDKANALQSRLN